MLYLNQPTLVGVPKENKFSTHSAISHFTIKIDHNLVWIYNVPLRVVGCEMRLLQLLYQHRGEVCHRDMICKVVFAGEPGQDICRDSRLDMLICKLRKKFRKIPKQPLSIETIRGVGYRLWEQPKHSGKVKS